MDKVQKIREEVVRLKSQLLRGACSSQIAMETRCKEEAYDEVITLLDSMQEEHDRIVNQCIYGKEPELVDVDDLPVVVDAPPEDYVKGFAEGRLYERWQKSKTSVWHDASEKPKKKCMFASGNFNDEDRKVTCDGCEKECIEKINEERKRDLSLWSLEDFKNNFFEIIKPYKDSRNYKNLCIRLLVWRSELWRWIHWKKRKEETVSEDLNIAIGEYCSNPDNFITYIDVAFAYRSEQKDDIPLIIKAIKFGAQWQKEQMMAKAVDGKVGYWNLRGLSVNIESPRSVKEGDKVKMIIIKED